jgi:glycosyltransferase involved in cell wall biosynthesis
LSQNPDDRAPAPAGPPPRVVVYLPYVDERAAGLQRYASQMVLALRRAGLAFELVVGEQLGDPAWLAGLAPRVVVPRRLSDRLPRAAAAFLRLALLQTIFLAPRYRGAALTVLALGHEVVRFPRFRQVAVAHDLTHLKDFSRREGWGGRLRSRWWQAGLNRCDRVIAISGATARDLIDVLGVDPARIAIVYEGVDGDVFKPAARDTSAAPYFLYAGTLQPHKNVGLVFAAFARVHAARPAATLRLVGHHPPAIAAALLATLSPAARAAVSFDGFVSDARLAELMAGTVGFVFPSRNEGFGLAPVEAMACGAPVLAADAGSLTEVVADGGVLLSPDDVEGWTTQMLRLLDDEAYRDDLSRRAQARSSIFSWHAAALSYMRLVAPEQVPSAAVA